MPEKTAEFFLFLPPSSTRKPFPASPTNPNFRMRATAVLQGRILSAERPAVQKAQKTPPPRNRSTPTAISATAHRSTNTSGRGAQNVRAAAAPERRDEVSDFHGVLFESD